LADLCGLGIPSNVQGKSIANLLDDPDLEVRDTAFSVAPMREGFLLREERYAYIQYGEDAARGIELFDTHNDPKQYTNLVDDPAYRSVVARFKTKLAAKLREVRDNDLPVTAQP